MLGRIGTEPHIIHVLLRLPPKLIPAPEDALAARYPDASATHIRADDGRTYRHDSGYHGSTLNYMLGHMSPQAWWALGKNVRRRHARAPFVGRRYFITANIAERAQRVHDDDAMLAVAARCQVRIEAQRGALVRAEAA